MLPPCRFSRLRLRTRSSGICRALLKREDLPGTADRLRHRQGRSAEALGSAHIGVVPLQPTAKTERPACSDLEIDPVRPQRAPGGDPAIGGDYDAVDEAGTAEPVEADA